jgi:hypothetical protein
VTDESNIASIQTSLSIDAANISALQSSLATVSSKQTTDEANISSLQSLVDTKANTNSPTFTGIPQVPTATAISNNAQIANTSYVDMAISSLVGTSPALLNTLQEINTAIINNDRPVIRDDDRKSACSERKH